MRQRRLLFAAAVPLPLNLAAVVIFLMGLEREGENSPLADLLPEFAFVLITGIAMWTSLMFIIRPHIDGNHALPERDRRFWRSLSRPLPWALVVYVWLHVRERD